MEFLLLTGLSGAGKSQALHALEDIGYFCIDNVPPELLERFFEACANSKKDELFAATVDARSLSPFDSVFQIQKSLAGFAPEVKIVFLDASDDVLVRRYKETRRRHPLMCGEVASIQEAIARERLALREMRAAAHFTIDTSQLTNAQLRERVSAMFSRGGWENMTVSLLSFGFKHGLPADADLVFDVRCLPNPFYVDGLRGLTGVDQPVRDYVFGFPEAQELFSHMMGLVGFSLPLYVREGKSQLVIAFGCTGGHHRSVAFAQAMSDRLIEAQYRVTVSHRDFGRT